MSSLCDLLIIFEYRAEHFCLKKWTWYALIVISFIGLLYYSYKKIWSG